MDKNEVMILNQYPPTQYNSLIPVATIQQVSDMHKVIVNQVKLDINEDAYKDKQTGKYPLKKTAILKLMAAANIRIVDSKPLQTQAFKEAMEMAKAIGKAVDYDKRDVAHQVTIEVPDMNGGFRLVKGTKEIVFGELPDNGQTREMLKHKRAHCETKALLRALRAAMMLKGGYDAQDFNKPFIVAIIVPNTDNESVKQIMLDKFAQANTLLFNDSSDQLAIGHTEDHETAEAVEMVMEDIDDVDMPDILGDNPEPPEKHYWCEAEGCGVEIVDTQKYTKEQITENSQRLFGKDYCISCQNKLSKQKN